MRTFIASKCALLGFLSVEGERNGRLDYAQAPFTIPWRPDPLDPLATMEVRPCGLRGHNRGFAKASRNGGVCAVEAFDFGRLEAGMKLIRSERYAISIAFSRSGTTACDV